MRTITSFMNCIPYQSQGLKILLDVNQYFTIPDIRNSLNVDARKIIHEVHLKNAEVHSLQLQLSHASLQLQALASRQFELKFTNEELKLALAQCEQALSLAEVCIVPLQWTVFNACCSPKCWWLQILLTCQIIFHVNAVTRPMNF